MKTLAVTRHYYLVFDLKIDMLGVSLAVMLLGALISIIYGRKLRLL